VAERANVRILLVKVAPDNGAGAQRCDRAPGEDRMSRRQNSRESKRQLSRILAGEVRRVRRGVLQEVGKVIRDHG